MVRRGAWLGRRAIAPLGLLVLMFVLPFVTGPGCLPGEAPEESLDFRNTMDPTNDGATYVGSAACSACHPDLAETFRSHGHGQALHRVQGAAPEYAGVGVRAGVPNPPTGRTWNDVSYVIGGYAHNALFVDRDGYVLTDGVAGVPTQWLLDFPPNGARAGFVPYLPSRAAPLPYEYDCFRCHTTGPVRQDAAQPRSQDGRPGIQGTWAEPGVHCEACHGPGSHHVPNPHLRNIFVDATVQTCARCHTAGDNPDVIVAADGYINPYAQYAELRASGGHRNFQCTICHDPHSSTVYDRARGLRNGCTVCHVDANLAFHDDFVFQRGDYREPVTCESCHMSFTGRSGSAAGPDVLGDSAGRIADVRSHIFRIAGNNGDYRQMFSTDGTQVVKDAQGRAAVSLDFVCLRCHNGVGNAFLLTPSGATVIAEGIHRNAARGN